MQLTKLTLSGFKSFARAITFEFPVRASAIVGPNGSGKSNVAESIRWVLGEQSLKTLRGKRGEDLIFNGSPAVSRMGKASVALTFENHDHAIPIDFREVTLERKIFRDGANEYYLNDSHVRLKDIVELLARMGLGETKHNIISQGEVDRILVATPEERRAMLEEAIGLRLFQLKKRQAERKLEETADNIERIQSLLRELSPHLKFLKSQADKAQKAETVQQSLGEHIVAYIGLERHDIKSAEERIRGEVEPAEVKLVTVEHEIQLVSEVSEQGRGAKASGPSGDSREEELEKLTRKQQELERELGRIEGRLEGRPQKSTGNLRVDIRILDQSMRPIISDLRGITRESNLDTVKRRISEIADSLEREIKNLSGLSEGNKEDIDHHNLENERTRIQKTIVELEKQLATLRQETTAGIEEAAVLRDEFRNRFLRLRKLEDERNDLKIIMQRAKFEEERLEVRRHELEKLVRESALGHEILARDVSSELQDAEPEELRKKIERLKARLEEIGSIDEIVLKEYRDTHERYGFLERELEDLRGAERDLRSLVEELEERIERDFKAGFEKIKDEFHSYFKIIFGGGRGILSYIPIRQRRGEDAETENDADEEGEVMYGIDIDVDLPRKRIKGLQMLSGGERALVSIALLFAITAVNPPPFLVLDETDAALDEANSQKYAATLKELSKKTQLIIITHNRETMKQAGVLYGVTMGEDGVSKVLSLKLEEAESYGNR